MLVLGIEVGDAIVIDGKTKVILVRSRDGKARLGFKAPIGVRIVREKVLQRDIEQALAEAQEQPHE